MLLRQLAILLFLLLLDFVAWGQEYTRREICGTDTVQVNYISLRTGRRVNYQAFSCRQVAKLGIRSEIGRSTVIYTPETARWLGMHSSGSFALYVAYGKFNFGARAVLATISPKTELVVDDKLLTGDAELNPIKIEYSAGYSVNIKYNFCLETYIAITSNKFHVINEDTLGKHYQIPQVAGFTAGLGLNKYLRIKEYQFLAAFVRYGRGFSNYRKVNSALGVGYAEWCLGVAYKGFAKKQYRKPLQNTEGAKAYYPRP